MSRKPFGNFSKYRHSVGKVAKHEEAYTDLKLSTTALADSNQLVKISPSWIAFKHASGGGSLGILPVETVGRVGESVYALNAHGSGVTDWEFSPFDANVLITGSENGEVKVWQFINDGDSTNSQLLLTITTGTGKLVETIAHHPTARGVLATASHNIVQIWDISNKEHGSTLSTATYTLTHPNPVCNISWKADGTRLATTCKDTLIRVFDPRQQESPIQTGQGSVGNRPSRVIWLGEKDLLFTQGFNKMREKEMAVWNANDLSKPLEHKRLDSSSGVMLPLYDEDTSMMFYLSRGESTLRWLEIGESSPFMTEGTPIAIPGPVTGVGLVPKRILNVMQTEVVRILAVNPNGLWPVSFSVPRRTYLDFHADLYPETKSSTPGLEAAQWLQGENNPVPRVSLDPGMAGKSAWQQNASNTTSSRSSVPAASIPSTISQSQSSNPPTPVSSISQAALSKSSPPPIPAKNANPASSVPQDALSEKLASTTVSEQKAVVTPPSSKPTAASSAALRIASQRTSKFRFLTFKPYHVSEHFENISGLSINTSPECSLIELNHRFMALPLQGSGGRVGILKTTEPGRVDNKIHSLVCSSELLSFKFDPFNPNLLVTASDDARIKAWTIPEGGLEENDVTKPDWVLESPTMDKISLILFHPRARDVLLSASMDRNDPTLRLWNLKDRKEVVSFKGHKDMIFSCAFNHLGTKIVSTCRDKKIRVWDALTGNLLQEGPGHQSLRSSRVLWLGESDFIASVGLEKGSQREILLYDSNNLSGGHVDKKMMDNSPGVLVPYYDPDTSILSICARGDRVMKHYEVLVGSKDDIPAGKGRFVDVASLEQGTLQQDVAYLPKRHCNVREVELAKMYRLTQSSVEVIGVSVPRSRKELFQDDLFPDTVDVEAPTMEADEFFANAAAAIERQPKKIPLCPSDMETLSHHTAQTPATPQGGNSLDKFLQGKQQVAEDEKKRLAMERMFETAKQSKADRDTLVPDTGVVDEDEWDD